MKTVLFFLALFLLVVVSGFSQTHIGFSYTTPPMPIVSAGSDTIVDPGLPFTLQGSVTSGTAPFSYQWQPAAYLDDNTLLTPQATITSDVTFTLTVIDSSGCEASDHVDITVDPTGISAAQAAVPGVYPNPSSGTFYIRGLDPSANEVSVNCYSVFGGLLASGRYTIKESTVKLDLQLPPGVYFLKLITNDTQYFQKIIIQ